MKTIRIAHLYYDLMNLYGENGNVRAIVKQLESQNVKVVVSFLTIDNTIDFSNYDFYYIGEGTIDNTLLVLNDLKKYKASIKKCVKEGKFFLVTGDSVSLFGESLIIDDEYYEGINVLPYTAKGIDFRIVGEQFYTSKLINEDIIGFQNRETIIDDYDGIFNVSTGTGFKPNVMSEGINVNNFYGTYLLGPLLVRNPYFTEYLVKELLKFNKIDYKEVDEDISYTAYREFIKNFKK